MGKGRVCKGVGRQWGGNQQVGSWGMKGNVQYRVYKEEVCSEYVRKEQGEKVTTNDGVSL